SFRGSTRRAASPTTSLSAGRRLTTRGTPREAASTAGRPKPSYSDRKTAASAAAYRSTRPASSTKPERRTWASRPRPRATRARSAGAQGCHGPEKLRDAAAVEHAADRDHEGARDPEPTARSLTGGRRGQVVVAAEGHEDDPVRQGREARGDLAPREVGAGQDP